MSEIDALFEDGSYRDHLDGDIDRFVEDYSEIRSWDGSVTLGMKEQKVNTSHGYHVTDIPRGVYGESSKIAEEVAELIDAEEQGATLMVLQELSDIIGAIDGYLEKNHPSIKLQDLIKMSEVTKRAFVSGQRKSKD